MKTWQFVGLLIVVFFLAVGFTLDMLDRRDFTAACQVAGGHPVRDLCLTDDGRVIFAK